MAVAAGDEVSGDVLAEQCDGGAVVAVADGERAAGVAGIRRVAKRGRGAKADIGKIEFVARRRASDRTLELWRAVELQHSGVAGRERYVRGRGPEQFKFGAAGDGEASAAGAGWTRRRRIDPQAEIGASTG